MSMKKGLAILQRGLESGGSILWEDWSPGSKEPPKIRFGKKFTDMLKADPEARRDAKAALERAAKLREKAVSTDKPTAIVSFVTSHGDGGCYVCGEEMSEPRQFRCEECRLLIYIATGSEVRGFTCRRSPYA
jgi:hypothetical protein